jgi:hypothetical protein
MSKEVVVVANIVSHFFSEGAGNTQNAVEHRTVSGEKVSSESSAEDKEHVDYSKA